MTFLEFTRELVANGLEAFGLYYGQYWGKVEEVEPAPPLGLNRVRVRAEEIWGSDILTTDLPWAWPAYGPGGAGHGMVWTPKVGDPALVTFHLGRLRAPRYGPAWWGATDLPVGLGGEKRGFLTPAGWLLRWDDTGGTFEVQNPAGTGAIKIDLAGNIVATGTTIKVGSATALQPAVLGFKLHAWLAALTVVGPPGAGKIDPAALTSFQANVLSTKLFEE